MPYGSLTQEVRFGVPPVAAPPPPPSVTIGLQVPALVPLFDTGIVVEAGQSFRFQRDRHCVPCPRDRCGSLWESFSGGRTCETSAPPHFGLTPGLPAWSLVGRIGPAGVPLAVGSSATIEAGVSGPLFLSMNDCSGDAEVENDFGDHSGAWEVSITTIPPPVVVELSVPAVDPLFDTGIDVDSDLTLTFVAGGLIRFDFEGSMTGPVGPGFPLPFG